VGLLFQYISLFFLIIVGRTYWSRPATLLLIDLYKQHAADMLSGKLKKILVWMLIAKAMKEKGHPISHGVCDKKWRNLNATYAKIKDNSAETGQVLSKWEFYEDMDNVCRDETT